jgi:hypothetical protein
LSNSIHKEITLRRAHGKYMIGVSAEIPKVEQCLIECIAKNGLQWDIAIYEKDYFDDVENEVDE